MNLAQTKQISEEMNLNQQAEQLLKMYDVADIEEQKAIVSHVKAFLPIVSDDVKVFWNRFLSEFEVSNEQSKVLFPLGKTTTTMGATEALEESNELPITFLRKHQSGNWGIIGKEDWQENEFSLKNGFRLFSAYFTANGEKLWVITEADRSVTTILLPEEY